MWGSWSAVVAFISMVVGLLKSIYIFPGMSLWLLGMIAVWVSVAAVLLHRFVGGGDG